MKKKILKKKIIRSKPLDNDDVQLKKSISDGDLTISDDSIQFSLSMEVFDGCWTGYQYKSKPKVGESIDDCTDRVTNFVFKNLFEQVSKLKKSKEDVDDE